MPYYFGNTLIQNGEQIVQMLKDGVLNEASARDLYYKWIRSPEGGGFGDIKDDLLAMTWNSAKANAGIGGGTPPETGGGTPPDTVLQKNAKENAVLGYTPSVAPTGAPKKGELPGSFTLPETGGGTPPDTTGGGTLEELTGTSGPFQKYLLSQPGYSQSSPAYRDYLSRQQGDLAAQYYLSLVNQMTNPSTAAAGPGGLPETTFTQFLANPNKGTPNSMNLGLSALQGILNMTPEELAQSPGLATLYQYYQGGGSRGQGNVFDAILQPGLKTVAPTLKNSYSSALEDIFRNYQLLNPQGQFINYAKEKGYY